MREEESSRYLSPLVKQDLAKLDTDGDTRRVAVKSLKLFVEQLDSSTLPRFVSQVNFFNSLPFSPKYVRVVFFVQIMAEHSNVIAMQSHVFIDISCTVFGVLSLGTCSSPNHLENAPSVRISAFEVLKAMDWISVMTMHV